MYVLDHDLSHQRMEMNLLQINFMGKWKLEVGKVGKNL